MPLYGGKPNGDLGRAKRLHGSYSRWYWVAYYRDLGHELEVPRRCEANPFYCCQCEGHPTVFLRRDYILHGRSNSAGIPMNWQLALRGFLASFTFFLVLL